MSIHTGIEITSDVLKYVVMERNRRGLRPLAYGRRALELDSNPGDLLRSLRDEGKIPTARVRVAAGQQTSHLRIVTLPRMPKRELQSVVQGEIDREVEVLNEEMAAGYRILRDRERRKIRVLIALSPRFGIAELYQQISSAGFEIEVMTPSAAALLHQALLPKSIARRRGCIGIVHIGVDRTAFTILDGGRIRLLRDLGLGLDSELLDQNVATGTDDGFDPAALDLLSQGLGQMTQMTEQIRKTLEYDASQFPDRPVEGLFVAGDVTRREFMIPLFHNQLDLPVELFNPLDDVKLVEADPEFEEQAASYTLPIVLAQMPEVRGLIHLGPPAHTERPSRFGYIGASAMIGTLALILVSGGFDRSNNDLREQIDRLHEERTELLGSVASGDPSTPVELTNVETMKLLQEPSPLFALRWLSNEFPAPGNLHRLSVSREGTGWSMKLDGSLREPDFKTRISDWRQLINNLERDPHVKGIRVEALTGGPQIEPAAIPFGLSFLREDRP